ncbi:MAG: T9SS type A sorting domain-containing protein [Ignavibacteria bacterium]|nr:T9SS type A sorting domain-containing protein [Ignavibacteria bacterium]
MSLVIQRLLHIVAVFMAMGSLYAQDPGWNRWWVYRDGSIRKWNSAGTKQYVFPGQGPHMTYREGLSCQWIGPFEPSGLFVDATGVRSVADYKDARGNIRMDTIFWKGSLKRAEPFRNDDMFTSSTSQIGLVPSLSNPRTLYFITPINKSEPITLGGYQDYSLSVIDLDRREVSLVDSAFNALQSIDTSVEHQTEMVGIASFATLNRIWIVFPFLKGAGFTSSSVVLYAFKFEDSILSRPVRTEVICQANVKGKMEFSVDGRLASIGRQILAFDPNSGTFRTHKTLSQPNMANNPAFSASGRYAWVPGYRITKQSDTENVIHQFDLSIQADTLVPVTTLSLGTLAWYNPHGYVPHTLSPDCKIYFSMFNQVFRVDHPDEKGEQVDTLTKQWMFDGGWPYSWQPDFGGMPDLVNQLTLRADSTSCLWARADFKTDTVCILNCSHITDLSYANVYQWNWEFEGGMPSTFEGKNPPCIVYSTPGEHRVRLIVQNSIGIDTIERKCFVLEPPNVDAGPDITVCPGQKGILTASGAKSYRWKPSAGLQNPNSGTTLVSPSAAKTVYAVEGTDSNGCVTWDTVIVTQDKLIAQASRDVRICEGESTILQATGGTVFTWWPALGLSRTDSGIVVARPVQTTTYNVEVRSGDCLDTATVTVSVSALPSVRTRGDTSLCFGSTTLLTADVVADSQYNVVWIAGVRDTISYTNEVLVSPLTRTTYRVVATTDAGCENSASITVEVERPRQVDDADTTICFGTTLVVAGVTYMPEADTSIVVMSQTSFGCADTGTVRIHVSKPSVVVNDYSGCKGPASLNAVGSFEKIVWYDSAGNVVGTDPTFNFEAVRSTKYISEVQTEFGCVALDTAVIEVLPGSEVSLTFGSAIAQAGNTVRSTVSLSASDEIAFPITIQVKSLWPAAIPLEIDNGSILSNGQNGTPIEMKLNAVGSTEILWQTYLSAIQSVVVTGEVKNPKQACDSLHLVEGELWLTGCGLKLRNILWDQAYEVVVFDLTGRQCVSFKTDSSWPASEISSLLDRGFYVLRVMTGSQYIDYPLWIE